MISVPARVVALPSSIVLVACAAILGTTLIGCGGAPMPSKAAAPSTPEPSTVEEAQEQIAQAKQELTGEAAAPASKRPSSDAASVSPSGGAARPESEAESKSEASVRRAESADSADARSESACSSPCRAIASMRRAVNALCRMTGPDDARCTDARRTLATSENRTAPCGC